jgi:hypothetical protein
MSLQYAAATGMFNGVIALPVLRLRPADILFKRSRQVWRLPRTGLYRGDGC